MMKRLHRRPRQHAGFVLIFVLAVLFFLATVGLATAYSLRLNAQVVERERSRVQDEHLLESAMQVAMLQLVKAQLAEPVLASMEAEDAAGIAMWQPGGTYITEIMGRDIHVRIEDASDLPDLNTFSREDVIELFRAMGADDSEAADYLEALQEARVAAAQASNSGGFTSLDEVLSVEQIPPRYRFGYTPSAEELEEDPTLEATRGIDRLVAVGTGSKTVNLNLSPIEVIRVLTRATPDALASFEAERQARTLTLTDAVRLLGPMASNYLREGATLQVRLTAWLPDGLAAQAMATRGMHQASPRAMGFRILPEGELP